MHTCMYVFSVLQPQVGEMLPHKELSRMFKRNDKVNSWWWKTFVS